MSTSRKLKICELGDGDMSIKARYFSSQRSKILKIMNIIMMASEKVSYFDIVCENDMDKYELDVIHCSMSKTAIELLLKDFI